MLFLSLEAMVVVWIYYLVHFPVQISFSDSCFSRKSPSVDWQRTVVSTQLCLHSKSCVKVFSVFSTLKCCWEWEHPFSHWMNLTSPREKSSTRVLHKYERVTWSGNFDLSSSFHGIRKHTDISKPIYLGMTDIVHPSPGLLIISTFSSLSQETIGVLKKISCLFSLLWSGHSLPVFTLRVLRLYHYLYIGMEVSIQIWIHDQSGT